LKEAKTTEEQNAHSLRFLIEREEIKKKNVATKKKYPFKFD